jgi:topoisomerase-4 subunit A
MMNNDTPDMFDKPAVPPAPTLFAESGDGSSLPLAAYAERAYLAYAMSMWKAFNTKHGSFADEYSSL